MSARAKYQALVVGQPSLGALLRHELVTMAAQSMPGAAGLALRKALYPLLLGACGRNVVFGQHVVVRHPHKIRIGDNVVIDDNCLLDAKGETNSGIEIGSGARGPITEKIQSAFFDIVNGRNRKYAEWLSPVAAA